MRRANVLIVILLASVALLLIACGKDDPAGAAEATATAAPATATATETTPARSSQDGCSAVALPQPAADPAAPLSKVRLNPRRAWTATVRTNCGTIRIRLAVGRAPKTASSFAGLVRRRYFDGLTFHRVAKPGGQDYVIQGGDPLGNGQGDPGYRVVEAPPKNLKYVRYVAAMAKTQTEAAGTSGSQFFIVTAADARLPPDYALLGEVVGDKRAVTRIAAVPTDPTTEAPVDPVVISTARISSAAKG